jgi:phthalate 4,5-dioxygenase
MSVYDTMTLTRVGAGTPMGKLLRRYWIPAAVMAEAPTSGGTPARIKLLGESLVLFRDLAGKTGLVEEFCPHRGVSLAYARVEKDGLRCLYHGWKIGQAGNILEAPAEPADSPILKRVCHTAYPTREAGGIIWTYMGPKEKEPPFPHYPLFDLKAPHLLVVKMYQDCNWLQGVEGDLDPAHPNYLHRDFTVGDSESWQGAGWNSISDLMHDGAPKIFCEETPYSMRYAAVRSSPQPELQYVRIFECVAPFYSYVAAGPHESRLFKAWHPIDDFNCFTFYIHYHPDKPLDPDAIYQNWGHKTEAPEFRTIYTVHNQHLQDREQMKRNFSGMNGAAIQDLALQESMGPVYDREKEHLATSDKAVVFYRRRMLQLIKDNEEGRPLPAQDPKLDFRQRGISVHVPAGRPWQDAPAMQEEYERAHPLPAAAE